MKDRDSSSIIKKFFKRIGDSVCYVLHVYVQCIWKLYTMVFVLSFIDGGYVSNKFNTDANSLEGKLSDAENFNCMSYIFFDKHEYAEYTSASVPVKEYTVYKLHSTKMQLTVHSVFPMF
jgi:hypothetical protein